MIEPISSQTPINAYDDAAALYYAERILEWSHSGYRQLALNRFQLFESRLQALLSQEMFNQLKQRLSQDDNWSLEREKELMARMKDAEAFNEYQTVHDCAHEILLHHHHRADRCPTHHLCDEINERLAANNAYYVEPAEVQINLNVDADVEFVVENRRGSSDGRQPRGNPGFHWSDTLGRRYRGFIKQADDARVGDSLKLKVTNIPGQTIHGKDHEEHILYLEPRVSPGDVIEVELSSLSHTRNSFTFRHHSYDGFLWFKRRGVNKEQFNERTLKPHDRLLVKILYITDEERRSSKGAITRLGVIKAIPLKRADEQSSPAERQETAVASARG